MELCSGKAVDIPPKLIRERRDQSNEETQTIEVEKREVGISIMETNSKSIQTENFAPTPLSARQIRLDREILDKLIEEIGQIQTQNDLFSQIDEFHQNETLHLCELRKVQIEMIERVKVSGIRCGNNRRIAVLCGEGRHESFCLHSGIVIIVEGTRRQWIQLGSCPTEATFTSRGYCIVGTASGEMALISEGSTVWSSTSMHSQSVTSLFWVSPTLLLSASMDGRIVLSSLQNNILQPLKSSAITVSDLPRSLRKSNSSAIKTGIVALSGSSDQLYAASECLQLQQSKLSAETGVILLLDPDSLSVRPIGYDIEGIQSIQIADDYSFSINSNNEAKTIERSGTTLEWYLLVVRLSMFDRNLLPPSYEEVSTICKEVLDEIIGQSPYQHTEVVKWNQTAVEKITERLALMNKPYKYCTCCVIMQTGLGAGLNVSSTCYWDKNSDHAFAYRWESRAIIAVCNVFSIAMSSK